MPATKVRPVYSVDPLTRKTVRYASIREAADAMGVRPYAIATAARYAKTRKCKGLIWRFEDNEG